MNDRGEKIRNLLVPIISVIFGFLLGAIIMLIFGYNPGLAYESMLKAGLGNMRSIGEVLRQASPLIFTALGFAVASAAGFFNIGLSGQALCGWVSSIWVALAFPGLPKPVLVVLCVVVGAIAGALAGAIPGALRAFFGTSEVITTIMLNYVFLYVSTYMIHNVFPKTFMVNKDSTNMIGDAASLRVMWLTRAFSGSRVSMGLFLALLALIAVWFIMKKTTLGFEIRAVGLNPFASEYAGMSSRKTIVLSMMLSGTLAGLGGVIEGLGTYQNFFVQTASLSIGFDGMAVSLLGSNSPIGILFAALLFSVLKIGGLGMQTGANVPFEIVNIVIASIIFFVGINYAIRLLVAKTGGKKKATVEVTEVKEVESKPDQKDSQEGGEL